MPRRTPPARVRGRTTQWQTRRRPEPRWKGSACSQLRSPGCGPRDGVPRCARGRAAPGRGCGQARSAHRHHGGQVGEASMTPHPRSTTVAAHRTRARQTEPARARRSGPRRSGTPAPGSPRPGPTRRGGWLLVPPWPSATNPTVCRSCIDESAKRQSAASADHASGASGPGGKVEMADHRARLPGGHVRQAAHLPGGHPLRHLGLLLHGGAHQAVNQPCWNAAADASTSQFVGASRTSNPAWRNQVAARAGPPGRPLARPGPCPGAGALRRSRASYRLTGGRTRSDRCR